MAQKTESTTSATVKVVVVVVLNMIPSVIIPGILDRFNVLSSSEAILMGVLIWILLNTSVMMYRANHLGEQEQQQQVLASIENDFDAKLANIQRNYRVLLANRRLTPDLFQSTFDQRLAEIDRLLFEAAIKDELHIKSGHMVSTEFLLRSFRGEPDDVFRPVHLFEDNDWFFNIIAKGYFYQVYQLVQQKKIHQVKRLMIYRTETELKDPRSLRMMRFHAVTPNYSYRAISALAFQAILRDNQPLVVPRDFGIYGTKYIYIAEMNQMDNLIGYYRRNPGTIGEYIAFFEKCWESPAAYELPSVDKTGTMSLDELFGSPVS